MAKRVGRRELRCQAQRLFGARVVLLAAMDVTDEPIGVTLPVKMDGLFDRSMRQTLLQVYPGQIRVHALKVGAGKADIDTVIKPVPIKRL